MMNICNYFVYSYGGDLGLWRRFSVVIRVGFDSVFVFRGGNRVCGKVESYYSRRGRFTYADLCHLSSNYLPVNGSFVIDQMSSCAYDSQFSVDGTFFCSRISGL